ncbi:MAG: ABC transporter permease [Acutalibacteraceae bacterium]
MSAVFKREFKAYFTSPIGYVVLAILFYFSGETFYESNLRGASPSLLNVYYMLFTVALLAMLPLLTMRLMSDDKRQKTDQALLTAPVSLTGVVLGKFLAALLLFALGIAITFVYALIIAFQVTPDWMVVIGNYLGLVLMGGALLAIGLLLSSLTESMFVAGILTFGVSYIWVTLDSIASSYADNKLITAVVGFLSISQRYNHFTLGTVQYNDVVFFLVIQALFLFLTVRLLDRKRWS